MARGLHVRGVEESWLVARRRKSVVHLESSTALLCDALSLIIRIICVSFFMLDFVVSSKINTITSHYSRMVFEEFDARKLKKGSVWRWACEMKLKAM